MTNMTRIELDDAELILLDGKVGVEVQTQVDLAKARLAAVAAMPEVEHGIAKFLANVVAEAKAKGELCYSHVNLRYCPICSKTAGYALHKRSGRYHRAGTPNHDKPLTFSGKELAQRFISMQGYVTLGGCNSCMEKAVPLIREAIKDIPVELPKWFPGGPSRFKKWNKVKCECGWEGHEGQLGLLPAVMGGLYPGKCPACGAENLPFGRIVIKDVDGFVVVEKAVETRTME